MHCEHGAHTQNNRSPCRLSDLSPVIWSALNEIMLVRPKIADSHPHIGDWGTHSEIKIACAVRSTLSTFFPRQVFLREALCFPFCPIPLARFTDAHAPCLFLEKEAESCKDAMHFSPARNCARFAGHFSRGVWKTQNKKTSFWFFDTWRSRTPAHLVHRFLPPRLNHSAKVSSLLFFPPQSHTRN